MDDAPSQEMEEMVYTHWNGVCMFIQLILFFFCCLFLREVRKYTDGKLMHTAEQHWFHWSQQAPFIRSYNVLFPLARIFAEIECIQFEWQ